LSAHDTSSDADILRHQRNVLRSAQLKFMGGYHDLRRQIDNQKRKISKMVGDIQDNFERHTYRMPQTSQPAGAAILRTTPNAQQKSTREAMDALRMSWDLESLPDEQVRHPTTCEYQEYAVGYHVDHPSEERKFAEIYRWKTMTSGLSWHEYPVSVRLRIIHYTVNHTLSGFRETDSLRWVLKGLPTKCLYRELLCEMNFNRMIFELDAGSPSSVE
jgi:hypothetical protein